MMKRTLCIAALASVTGCMNLQTQPDSALTQALQRQAETSSQPPQSGELSIAEIEALVVESPPTETRIEPLTLRYEGNSPALTQSQQQALIAKLQQVSNAGLKARLRCIPPADGDAFSRSHLALKRCQTLSALFQAAKQPVQLELSHRGQPNSAILSSHGAAP